MFESERKFSLHVYMCMCKNKMIVLKSRPLMWKAVKSKSTRTTEKSRALSRPHESHESVRSESVRILIVSIFMNCHKQKFSSKNSIDIGAEIRIDERFHFSFKYRIQIHIEIYIYALQLFTDAFTVINRDYSIKIHKSKFSACYFSQLQ